MLTISSTLLLFSVAIAAATADEAGPTVHDLLPKYGLPRGLVPDAVESYSLSADGKFEIQLSSPCYVHFSSLTYYHTRITGKLSYGAISNLDGIQAKKLFLWVSISGMVAHPDKQEIEFQVGPLAEWLPYSEFQDVPKCLSSLCEPCCGAHSGFFKKGDETEEEEEESVLGLLVAEVDLSLDFFTSMSMF